MKITPRNKSLLRNSLIVAAFIAAPVLANEAEEMIEEDMMLHQHKHHAAAFVGATNGEDATEATLGLDYEFRLPVLEHRLGVGAAVEHIFADVASNIFAAGVVVHPWQALRFNLMAGVENAESHSESLYRIGAAYDVRVKNFMVAPTYNFDSVGDTSLHVFGVSVGYGF